MADIDLAAVERELRARHDELEERLAALARPPERGSTVGFGKRIGDGTTVAVSRLTVVGVDAYGRWVREHAGPQFPLILAAPRPNPKRSSSARPSSRTAPTRGTRRLPPR